MADWRASRELVLVDGRSGAGKTHFASDYARRHQFLLLSLDDVYPGWDGLDAGHWRVYRDVIVPWWRGEASTVRSWDWQEMAPGAPITIDPSRSIVIEGCGALSRFTAPHATSRYWLEADATLRKHRALERDGELFAPHWVRWALQEERFYDLHGSRDLADVIIAT